MGKVLIVSNRLPVTVKPKGDDFEITPSAGGLATGLRGPHQRSDSLWIGWPGALPRLDKASRTRLEEKLAGFKTAPVYLSDEEVQRYYENFSNGVLWPLFHYLTDKLQTDVWENWTTYAEVNQRFAEMAAEKYRPGDSVWIHDYQLALVPVLLRQLVPDAKIGFFLHIPFPSSDVFRILPWRTEILEGMLGADLVGFHTYSYVRHFSRSLNLILRLDVDNDLVHYSNRDVRLGVFPMGIDTGRFTSLASSKEVIQETESLRRKNEGHKLLVGIDRLDYTKGLPRRMLAIDRLLTRAPELRGKIRFIQVVVPSRTNVESYKSYRQELDEMVGRINGEHATLDSVPINYLYTSVSEIQLVALYKAADVMLVNPLRDGMNLVAKEFVASRTDGDGVLVLSEFAGAASELAEAVLVNPYDSDGTASMIQQALSMRESERRARMQALRRRVTSYDSYRWADAFLHALAQSGREIVPESQRPSPPELIGRLSETLRKAKPLVLLLDYDGTLVPYANSPLLAAPDPDLIELLEQLAAQSGTTVHIMSGRSPEIMDQWFAELPIGLDAEHGFWFKSGPGAAWTPLREQSSEWKDTVLPILEDYAAATPGALIEEKTAAFSWHYRMADPEFGDRKSAELIRTLGEVAPEHAIEVIPGKKVIEVRMRDVHKGVIVSRVLKGFEGEDPVILGMGDHRTDEDLFAALPPGCCSVHVGPRPSRAEYRLADPSAARAFLRSILSTN
jgi:trehalose 6-phosphate synthase/phosphatase